MFIVVVLFELKMKFMSNVLVIKELNCCVLG